MNGTPDSPANLMIFDKATICKVCKVDKNGRNKKHSKTRWFKPWPFYALIRGHLTFPKGHVFTIPKRSPAELPSKYVFFCHVIALCQRPNICIPGPSKCVKFVHFHPKNLPKGRNFIYLEDPGIMIYDVPGCQFMTSKTQAKNFSETPRHSNGKIPYKQPTCARV